MRQRGIVIVGGGFGTTTIAHELKRVLQDQSQEAVIATHSEVKDAMRARLPIKEKDCFITALSNETQYDQPKSKYHK